MPRELARQATLIAARDELGLNTRDGTLRESAALNSPAAKHIHIETTDVERKGLQIVLIDPSRSGSQTILDHDIPLPRPKPPNDRFDYVQLVVGAEEASRTKLPEALRRAGFTGQANRVAAAVEIPAEISMRLNELNAFSQFAAVRGLHALQREQGESPATLSAISRAYANLGQLTQYHFNASHKAFKARALLYAQRLLQREPENPLGRWSRAYALAMTGLHKAALDDFAAAGNAPAAAARLGQVGRAALSL